MRLFTRGLRFVCALALAPLAAFGAERGIEFNRDIRPILSNRCFKCHGPAVQEAGLRLDASERATAELPSSATAIVSGNPDASALVERVAATDAELRMPPVDEGPALTAAEIETLRAWIAQGAVYQPHWAFIPPARSELPAVQNEAWPRGAIDRFLLARMESEGLSPAAEASRGTLIRRLSLDLIGLPPTPDEVRAFESDTSPDAYEKLVDRLLASPQFGVRQALVWLDLARYADTDGFPNDGVRQVWPYRDWVVDALNADMPFDQFTIEQLAGDLLPNPTDAQLVASAFHRHTRINREAGVDPEEFRIEAVLDRVNTTATVWLAATLACAQCHDHKYDPFSQRDYYRLLAFFNNDAIETTTDEAGRISDVSPKFEWSTPERRARFEELEARIKDTKDSGEREKLVAERDALKPAQMLVMRRNDSPRKTHVFVRGSFLTPGEEVTPGTPSVFDALLEPAAGDRLALARWLVDKRNPLTARVAANRLWAQYFGTGLVETLEDFGTQGPPPSHPELLDWLALELMEGDWRQKRVHRLIVTSAAYRQSALASPQARERDPNNRWLAWFPRVRLSAELVRDNALAAAGMLALDLGGESIVNDKLRARGDESGRQRRSIYLRWKRQALDDMLVNFDAPSRDVSCTRRTRTNTPLQALTLLNDRVFLDSARGLARRGKSEGGDELAGQISAMYWATLAREPKPRELETLSALYERRRAGFLADSRSARQLLLEADEDASPESLAEQAALVLVANTILNLNETITRE